VPPRDRCCPGLVVANSGDVVAAKCSKGGSGETAIGIRTPPDGGSAPGGRISGYPEVVMSERAAFLARLARIAVTANPIGVAGWALQVAQPPS
jgi:hypothetical protein